MKKIAIFGTFAIAMLACIGFTACNNDVIETPEPEVYTVQLGWEGEILDVSYEPMITRATATDLYSIKVYSKPNNSSTATKWEKYAFGIFNDPANISIDLASGNKYKFIAEMLVNGMERVELLIDSEDVGVFKEEFPSNNFGYHLDIDSEKHLEFSGFHNIDTYYGELENFVPSNSNADVIIPMKRISFGAKFVAEGALAKSGILMIDGLIPLVLTEDDDSISDIFSFQNAYEAWRESDLEEYVTHGYFEIGDISFKWIRPDGTELQIGTFRIKFRRKKTTVVTIKMENDVVEGNLTGGIGFSIANTELGEMPVDEDNSVTIVDGDIQ